MRLYKATLVLFILLFLILAKYVSAKDVVQCGSIIEGEFTENRQVDEYTIDLSPGDVLRVSGDRVGAYLSYDLDVTSPLGRYVIGRSYDQDFSGEPSGETAVLSERGTYTIQLVSDATGLYTLYVGCTLRDGTTIDPGDPIQELSNPAEGSLPVVAPDTPPFGFAGLPPVDFASVVPFSIPAGVPMTGGITPTGNEILGYLVNGNEGDVVELHFTRLSGNLNLGIVVLSQNNELAFQASLITTNTLTTQFTLPSTGEYTVGVFRVNLLPPDTPEPTTFQIQVVNP